MQAQLAVGQRAPQALLDLGGVQQPAPHALRGELRAAAAALARTDRRGRRRAQQLAGVADAALGDDDADARRRRQLAPAGEHRLAQRQADPVRELEQLRVTLDVGHEHAELVSREPPGGGARRQHAAQARARAGEHLVAGAVAKAVVELGEAVEIDEQQAGLTLAAARSVERLLEAVLEQRPVREAGERVVQAQAGDLLVHAPARDGRADDVGDRLREADVLDTQRGGVGGRDRE